MSAGFRAWWQGFDSRTARSRVRGAPTSSNGASSFHLPWVLAGRFRSVAVTFEVLEEPSAPRLYFWALQAGFLDGGRRLGAAHLGLQWHPRYPGSTAVNWGGYREGGGELAGSASDLPGALGNANTRDFPWVPRRPYRLTIQPGSGPGQWAGTVTDTVTGEVTLVRELVGGGTELVDPIVWSEVFARCDDPSVSVRWSNPVAVDAEGREHRPRFATVNYQDHAAGGCTNTTARPDEIGITQITATERVVPVGARLAWPGSDPGTDAPTDA